MDVTLLEEHLSDSVIHRYLLLCLLESHLLLHFSDHLSMDIKVGHLSMELQVGLSTVG